MRSLLRDRRGVTAVEFALVAPVLISLICGTIEFGHFFMTQSALDGALLEAARLSAASMESSTTTRDAAMRSYVAKAMTTFKPAVANQPTISVVAYANFHDSHPEPFKDTNHNGVYDAPHGSTAGEPFTDTNGNGKWDDTTPKSSTVGDTGDVVRYTATYKAAYLFKWVSLITGKSSMNLQSVVVTRNEPVTTS